MQKTTKRIAAIGVSAAVLASAGVAYAYWTTSASGSGTSTNAASNGTLTLAASWNSTALYPGGSQTVSFTASNPSKTTLRLGTIKLASVSVDAAHAACAVSDFTMPDVPANQSIETTVSSTGVDTPEAITATGTLSFANDSTTSQDACKNADITLHLTSADPYTPIPAPTGSSSS